MNRLLGTVSGPSDPPHHVRNLVPFILSQGDSPINQGLKLRAREFLLMDDLPRRCIDYRPKPGDSYQRRGSNRWPWMMKTWETLQ